MHFHFQMPTGEHKLLTVINVYCPRLRNDPDDPVDNTDYKYTFHSTLGKRANALVANGSFVIVMGDFNIAHRPIDRVEADDTEVKFSSLSPFHHLIALIVA